MNYAFLTVWLAFLLPGLYIAANIPFCAPVEATLVDYTEHEFMSKGMNHTNYNAVYTYEYNGWQRRFESHVGRWLPFTCRQTKTLYIRKKDGKVFEKENALALLGPALLMVVANKSGMLH